MPFYAPKKSPQDWWKQGMEDAAKIAGEHKGSAYRDRKAQGNRHWPSLPEILPHEALERIQHEEHGEDIAADIISEKILLASNGKRPVEGS